MVVTSKTTPFLSSYVMVSNGSSMTITSTGSMSLSTPSSLFHLHNVLIVPHLIYNLILVRQFTRDNSCSIEFDHCSFSVKDLCTKRETFCCNRAGDLYSRRSTTTASSSHGFLVASSSSELWYQRLGHLGHSTLSILNKSS